MRTSRNPTRWTGLIAGPVLALTLLSGCGVAGTEWHPGVAAEVGDEVVTTNRLDSVVTAYCSAIEEQVAANGQALPLSLLRTGIVGQLALVSAAEQLADLYGVDPAGSYDQQVRELKDAVAELPEDVQEAVLDVETANAYLDGVSIAIGRKQLRDRGQTPTDQEASAIGQQTFADWIAENPVDIDPRYGVEVTDGGLAPVDDTLSVAVGETAQQGTVQQPDPAYTERLPSTQRCG